MLATAKWLGVRRLAGWSLSCEVSMKKDSWSMTGHSEDGQLFCKVKQSVAMFLLTMVLEPYSPVVPTFCIDQ